VGQKDLGMEVTEQKTGGYPPACTSVIRNARAATPVSWLALRKRQGGSHAHARSFFSPSFFSVFAGPYRSSFAVARRISPRFL